MPNALTIKVCGLRRRCDVELCGALGVDMTGFIFHPSSPRAVSPQDVASLPQTQGQRVGVFVRQTGREIQGIMDEAGLDVAQFHGGQGLEDAAMIGPQRVIRVVWPERYATAEALQAHLDTWAAWCRYFLCDSGVAGGGHGRQLRGTLSLQQVAFPRPWLLAGGICATNVQKKVAQFQPDGIDMNSGVETNPAEKNNEQLTAAVQVVRGLE